MSEAKPYAIVFKGPGRKLPLCRYVSRTKYSGTRRVVTLAIENAVLFKDREDAIFYINNLFLKYPDQAKRMYPMKLDTILKRSRKNPVKQIRTGKILFPLD